MERVQVEQCLKTASKQYVLLCVLLSMGHKETRWECWLWKAPKIAFPMTSWSQGPVILKGTSTIESKGRGWDFLPWLVHYSEKSWYRSFYLKGREPNLLALLQILKPINLLNSNKLPKLKKIRRISIYMRQENNKGRYSIYVSVHIETMGRAGYQQITFSNA